jgi:hypothetical protein
MTQWGLDVLFNPAKRHMDDEKQRLQSTREEVGDASKGNRIDLSTGKVVIRRKVADEVADEATNAAADEVSDEAATEADETADHPATSAESELD